MREVPVQAVPLSRLAHVLSRERAEVVETRAAEARRILAGRTVWNISSTVQGGGVAELLQMMVGYGLGAGVRTRWLVLSGDPQFFVITKRLHNLLHDSPGDSTGLAPEDYAYYHKVLAADLERLAFPVRAGDVVVLHDPQTAGLVGAFARRGAHVVWRCHIGADGDNRHTSRGWEFLRPLLEDAEAWVFSRRAYAPPWLPDDRVWVIPPSIDPFSPKNSTMTPDDVSAVLSRAGIVGTRPGHGTVSFTRRDGAVGSVRRHRELLLDEDGAIPSDAKVLLQVSRWDRLKDMAGVLTGFAEGIDRFPDGVHLVLAGPDVGGVVDDPEGASVLDECRSLRAGLTERVRPRVHLCCLPMDDVDENARIVNPATPGVSRGPEEPGGRLRPHRHRGDVELRCAADRRITGAGPPDGPGRHCRPSSHRTSGTGGPQSERRTVGFRRLGRVVAVGGHGAVSS